MLKMVESADFSQVLLFLDSLGRFRIKPGLDRMRQGLDKLGRPDRDVFIIQVVGTNGKGSAACFLESLAREHGLLTGLYTSPHLISVRERIMVAEKKVSRKIWAETAAEIASGCGNLNFSYFEFLTLMAVLIFRKMKVDLAVMEAGLGGSFDATSALDQDFHVFTRVGLDHTRILGSTTEEIARDKAGAMSGSPAVIARQEPVVMEIFRQRAAQVGTRLYSTRDWFVFEKDRLKQKDEPGAEIPLSCLGLAGPHQLDNAAAALLAWKKILKSVQMEYDHKLCLAGLKKAFWPGRMQVINTSPLIILDAAHNPQALLALKKALEISGIKPRTMIFSCLADKEVADMAEIIKGFRAQRIFVPALDAGERSCDPELLCRQLGPSACPALEFPEILARMKPEEGPVLVCGSLYLLGLVYARFPERLCRQG